MKLKTLGIILGAGISAAAALNYTLNYFADKEINRAVFEKQSVLRGWVSLVPGKTDKFIDLYLKNLDLIYSRADKHEKKLVADYLVNFSQSYAPERLNEVNAKGIDFLIKKGNLFGASWMAAFSGDKSLVEKVKKAEAGK